MANQFVIGADKLEALLKKLPENVSKKVVTAALRSGAAIIAKQARANLRASPSVDSGLLAGNITSRTRRRSRKGKAVVSVGAARKTAQVVRKGKSKPIKASPSRYAHFIEFGTEKMPAEPFMRPALDTQGGAAIAKIMEMMGRGVEREARKMAGK